MHLVTIVYLLNMYFFPVKCLLKVKMCRCCREKTSKTGIFEGKQPLGCLPSKITVFAFSSKLRPGQTSEPPKPSGRCALPRCFHQLPEAAVLVNNPHYSHPVSLLTTDDRRHSASPRSKHVSCCLARRHTNSPDTNTAN